MLATRIIPTLLCRGRQLVKGKQFKSWRSVGLVSQAMRIHQARGVDEVILLDIQATKEKRGPDLKLIEELSRECSCPITVGGGVQSTYDVEALLRAGADKIAICSAAMKSQFKLIEDCAKRFGSQAIVAVVEYDNHKLTGQPIITTMGGKYQHYGDPYGMAMELVRSGAGEIMLSSVHRDGMMLGYDTALVNYIARSISVPLIVSGGCGTYGHMLDAINAGADAVAAGAIFQFTDQTPRGAAEYLQKHGVEVRLD